MGTAASVALGAPPRTGLSAGSLREPPRRIFCARRRRAGLLRRAVGLALSDGADPKDAPWSGRGAPARSARSAAGWSRGFQYTSRTATHDAACLPLPRAKGTRAPRETGAGGWAAVCPFQRPSFPADLRAHPETPSTLFATIPGGRVLCRVRRMSCHAGLGIVHHPLREGLSLR